MLNDFERNRKYKKALARIAEIYGNQTFLEIGSGLVLLSMYCIEVIIPKILYTLEIVTLAGSVDYY